MPHLKKLHEKYGDQGLVILAIHSQRGREKCAGFVADKKIPYVVCEDHNGTMTKAFYVDGFPDYQIIGRDGKVRVADLQNAAVDQAVKALIAEPAPKKKTKEPAAR